MPRRSDQEESWDTLQQRIIGLGEQSARKSYYPELQKRLQELELMHEQLHEQNVMLEQEIAERQSAQEALAVKQQELEGVNASLAERIQAAVAELRQKDELLLHQSRLAAMGELLQSIAHQWRQPLNNVAAYLQSMRFLKSRGELNDREMEHDIAAVLDILQYMSKTIDDFRNFFRADRTAQAFEVSELVKRALNLVSSGLANANIAVRFHEEARPWAQGQPNEFAQSLVNILYNARDVLVERAIAEPMITLTVGQDADRSLVTVQDNAGGITAEVMPRLFTPYFTTKGPAHGTGIGLYMSKMIIERNMRGTLTCCNTDGGAAFSITLPLAPKGTPASAPTPSRSRPVRQKAHQHRR